MSSAVVVGLDVGTSALKAIAVDERGAVVAAASRAYDVSMPRPGWSEQDPADWNRAADEALAELEGHEAVATITAIGLSGQMHGLVALDDQLQPVRPAILWNDQRATPQVEEIERLLGIDGLLEHTGNRTFPGFTAPKLAWMRQREPELHHRVAHVLLPKDSLRLHLTGELGIDVSDASGTSWLDVRAGRWSATMLDAWCVDPAVLPPLVESGAVVGATASGIPVVAGAGDQAAAGLGVGAVAPGVASIVLGTSGVVFAALDDYAAEPEGRLHVFCHAVPDMWHAMGVMISGAGSLTWFRDAACPDVSVGDLLAEAAAADVTLVEDAGSLWFLPYLSGERTPHVDPLATGSFVGLRAHHRRPDLVGAILRGTCFGLADGMALLRRLTPVDVARVSGGGARSAAWVQLLADTLELPIEVLEHTEGSAMGAAVLAASHAWHGGDVAAASLAMSARPVRTVEPDAAHAARLAEAHKGFQALFPAIRGATA